MKATDLVTLVAGNRRTLRTIAAALGHDKSKVMTTRPADLATYIVATAPSAAESAIDEVKAALEEAKIELSAEALAGLFERKGGASGKVRKPAETESTSDEGEASAGAEQPEEGKRKRRPLNKREESTEKGAGGSATDVDFRIEMLSEKVDKIAAQLDLLAKATAEITDTLGTVQAHARLAAGAALLSMDANDLEFTLPQIEDYMDGREEEGEPDAGN